MAVRIRDELVGKRFLAVKGRSTILPGSNDRPTDWAGLPGSCNWNSGVVRAATGKVLSDESFQILVEYDGLGWQSREWITVNNQLLAFLIEETLVWVADPREGKQSKLDEGKQSKLDVGTTSGDQKIFQPALTFRTVIDRIEFEAKNLTVIEHVVDKRLELVEDLLRIRPFKETDLKMTPAICDDPAALDCVRLWMEFQSGQKILLETPSILVGYRTQVYRTEGTTQWFTAVIKSYNVQLETVDVLDDTVLEEHQVNPSLVQMNLIGDGVINSILNGDEIKIRTSRTRRSSRQPANVSSTGSTPVKSNRSLERKKSSHKKSEVNFGNSSDAGRNSEQTEKVKVPKKKDVHCPTVKNELFFKPRVKQKSLSGSSESVTDLSETESDCSVSVSSSSPRKSNSFSVLERTLSTDPLLKYKTQKLTIKIDRNYFLDAASCRMPLRSKLKTEEKLATGLIDEGSDSLNPERCIKREIVDNIKSVVEREQDSKVSKIKLDSSALVDTKPTVEKETEDEKFLKKEVCPSNGELNLNFNEKVSNSLKLPSSNDDESCDVRSCSETIQQPVRENGLEEKVTKESEFPSFGRSLKGNENHKMDRSGFHSSVGKDLNCDRSIIDQIQYNCIKSKPDIKEQILSYPNRDFPSRHDDAGSSHSGPSRDSVRKSDVNSNQNLNTMSEGRHTTPRNENFTDDGMSSRVATSRISTPVERLSNNVAHVSDRQDFIPTTNERIISMLERSSNARQNSPKMSSNARQISPKMGKLIPAPSNSEMPKLNFKPAQPPAARLEPAQKLVVQNNSEMSKHLQPVQPKSTLGGPDPTNMLNILMANGAAVFMQPFNPLVNLNPAMLASAGAGQQRLMESLICQQQIQQLMGVSANQLNGPMGGAMSEESRQYLTLALIQQQFQQQQQQQNLLGGLRIEEHPEVRIEKKPGQTMNKAALDRMSASNRKTDRDQSMQQLQLQIQQQQQFQKPSRMKKDVSPSSKEAPVINGPVNATIAVNQHFSLSGVLTKESHMTSSTSGPSMHRDVILPSRQSQHPSKNRTSSTRPEGVSGLVHSPLQGLNLTVHSSAAPPVEYRTSNQSVAPSAEHLANNCVSKPNCVPSYFNSTNNSNPRLTSTGHTFDLLGYNSTPLKFINEVEKEIRLPNVNASLKPLVRGPAHTDNVVAMSSDRSKDPNYYSNCEQTVVLDLQKRPTKREDVSSAGFPNAGSMNYLVGSQGAPVTLASISRMDQKEPSVSQSGFQAYEQCFRDKLHEGLSVTSILSCLSKEDDKFHAANLIGGSGQPNGGGTQHGLTREFADKVYNFGFGTMKMSSKHSLDDSSDSQNSKRSRMSDVKYVGSEGVIVPSTLANYLQSSMASSTGPSPTTVASSRVSVPPVNQNSKNFQQAYACYIKVEGGLAPSQLLPNVEQLETKPNSFQNLLRGNVAKSDSMPVRSVARPMTDETSVQNSAIDSEVKTKVEEGSLAWNNGPPVITGSPIPQNIPPPVAPSPTLKCHAGRSSTPGSTSSMMETFGAMNGGDSDTQSAHSPATLPKTGDSEPSTPRSPQSHSGSRPEPCSIRNNIKKQWLQKYKEEDQMKDTTSERKEEKEALDGMTVASRSVIVETEKNDSSCGWNSSSELETCKVRRKRKLHRHQNEIKDEKHVVSDTESSESSSASKVSQKRTRLSDHKKGKSESMVRDDCSSNSSAGFLMSEINEKTSSSHPRNDLSYECLRKMSEWRKETEEEKQVMEPTDSLARKASEFERRTLDKGDHFLQNGNCTDVTPKIFKCRDCKMFKGKKDKPDFYCRFYAFRRLKYTVKGSVSGHGFSEPSDADGDDIRIWMPSYPIFSPPMSVDLARYIASHVGDCFKKLVKQEEEARDLMPTSAKVAWKRAVLGVCDTCDQCSATLFNMHAVCEKCGFAVCMDCYRIRVNAGGECDNGNCHVCSDHDGKKWLMCNTGNHAHDPEKMMRVQIIPSDVLWYTGEMLERCGASQKKTSAVPPKNGTVSPSVYSPQVSPTDLPLHFLANVALAPESLPPTSNKLSPRGASSDGAMSTCTTLKDLKGSLSSSSDPSTSNGPPSDPLQDVLCRLSYDVEWHDERRLLRLLEPDNSHSVPYFQHHWSQGLPVVVSNCKLDEARWRIETIAKEFVNMENNLTNKENNFSFVNCENMSSVNNLRVKRFWDGFERIGSRNKDKDGRPQILKLKEYDWPLKDQVDGRFQDLMLAMPLPEYTSERGDYNLVSRLPSYFQRPELGPKMYAAYGLDRNSDIGTTNLNFEVSDHFNLLVSVRIPKDDHENQVSAVRSHLIETECSPEMLERFSKSEVPGALWHIYKSADADKIRQFLEKVAIENEECFDEDEALDHKYYLDRTLRDRLKNEFNVQSCTFVQGVGDSVFIPAGAPYQVRNLHGCVNIEYGFVSPENGKQTLEIIQDSRHSPSERHSDKVQIKNLLFHSMKDVIAVLNQSKNS